MTPQIDPILTRFRATLDEIYGPRLERVMLEVDPACETAGAAS
jgi:hypothetical protein